MTDLRALCARMADKLDHYRQVLMDDRRATHALATEARRFLAQSEPQVPMPEVDDILRLAAIIREVNGSNDKGAAALAEAILSHPDSRWQHAQPEPQGPTDEELITMWATTRYIDQPEGGLAYGRAVLARWGRPAIEPVPGVEVE